MSKHPINHADLNWWGWSSFKSTFNLLKLSFQKFWLETWISFKIQNIQIRPLQGLRYQRCCSRMDEGILHMFGLGGKFAGLVAFGLKDPGIKPLNLHRDCWRISKMKVFFGQKNAKYIAWSKEREVTMLAPLVPKTWDQPTWKYTHFTNKNYFGFPKKKTVETLTNNQNGRCPKISQSIVFSLFFFPFPTTSQNGNQSSVRRGKTSGETPNISQVRKSIQSLLGEMDGTGSWMATIR